MARLATLRKGDWDQFDRNLNATDLTAEEVLKLNKHPEVLQVMLEAMRKHPAFRMDLIHGVFNTAESVLAAFKARCEAKGIDFGKFSWVGSEQAPEFDPNDTEMVVVLDATLDTLQNTFEFAWEWTKDGQDDSGRWEGMVSDASKLRLLSDDRPDDAKGDGPDFKPWTLSWRRIKLNVGVSEKPVDLRDPKSSPGCALLFMSAEHPARIKATDYEKRFGFWLPGLKCTAPDEGRWQNVPCVGFGRDDCGVHLNSDLCDYSLAGVDLAVPVLRE